MSTVTAAMVKELRERTGAGMTDCKKALDATAGDIEKAIVVLREKGLAAAAKKAGRAAAEGMVSAVVANNKGFLVEVNCETDFVTRNDAFQAFVEGVNAVVGAKAPTTLEQLLDLPLGATTVKGAATELVAKIGENIGVRRFAAIGNGSTVVNSYVHGGGKIGVIVELEGTQVSASAEILEVAKDVALQVSAMKPLYTASADVPASVVDAEKEVLRNKYLNQGKPEAALAKIVPGAIQAWFKEICLVEQLFVKDDSKTIAAYVSEAGKKAGVADLKVKTFVRFELGEGVEKKSADDFAAEVAAQIAAAAK